MLKLLLGHWHIHRKKPLLLPPEAELYAEGHNDQNPVNRINPLYEATDSDELNSVLSIKNDAQLSDPEKAKNTQKNDGVVAQDGKPNEVEHFISENSSNKTEKKRDLLETVDSPPSTSSEDSGLPPVNLSTKNHDDANREERSDDKANNLNDSQTSEYPSGSSTERNNLEKSIEEKVNSQEKLGSQCEAQDSVSSEGHAQEIGETKHPKNDNTKLEKNPGQIRADNEILGESSHDNAQITEKSRLETVVSDNLQTGVKKSGADKSRGATVVSDNLQTGVKKSGAEKSRGEIVVSDNLQTGVKKSGAEKSEGVAVASDNLQTDVKKSGAAKSKLKRTAYSHKETSSKASAPDINLKSGSTENNLGTSRNEDSDQVQSTEEKAKYSANWVNVESKVEKAKPPRNAKEISVAMGISREVESTDETVSSATKTETHPSGGILKSSLKVRAKAIDELIKKFQPTSSDVKESGVGKIGKVIAHNKKRVFAPSPIKSEGVNGNSEFAGPSKKPSVSGKTPEITFPPPPPPEPTPASVPALSKIEKSKRNKEAESEGSAVVRTAVSSVKSIPSSSKSVQTPTGPSSSFLFGDKNGETKTVSSVTEEDAKVASSKKTEESKTTSSGALNQGRFKKNERSVFSKRLLDVEEPSNPSSSSKAVSSQKDEIREKKSGLVSKEPEKPKLIKNSALKQSSAFDKTNNPKTHVLKKAPKNDEIVKSLDEPVALKKDTKSSKATNSATEKAPKKSETVTSTAKDNQPSKPVSEWPSVKDKVDQANKIKLQSSGNGDVSPKSDSLIGKSQSEDSGITRGDQISSDSQVSDKLQEPGVGVQQTKDPSSETANDNVNKSNTSVPSPKTKHKHTKERKRLQKHGHRGTTCKHCKRTKHDFLKSSGLAKGGCDDYYDKVIMDGLPGHRRVRRPDSWASDMSWEEFAERDFIARLRREDLVFDKHKHLNSSFKKRLAKQRHLHGDPFHQKIHHADEVFIHPDPYRNGRHHRSHRRQSSLSDDSSTAHFDRYYSRTPSVCSCEDCWSISHFPQVNFGRSSVRSKFSDWDYNDLCTCHIIPDFLEHRRKVKFAENHSTDGPFTKEKLERTNSEEDEEANSGSLGSADQASSISDGNSGSHSAGEGANEDAKNPSGSVRKGKPVENGNGPKVDSKINEQYQPHPWEIEEWDRLMRHRLLKKRRRRAMCMGVMALAMVVFIGLIVAIVMVYLRRKML